MTAPIGLFRHDWSSDEFDREPNTRLCDFAVGLTTPRGVAFADFDQHGTDVLLVRISLDGQGCFSVGSLSLPADDARTLVDAVLATQPGESIDNADLVQRLIRCFAQIDTPHCQDALTAHQLTPT